MMRTVSLLVFATAASSALVSSTTTNAASLSVDFQATIASEQHPEYAGEARYYHVSVNPVNAGIGSYAATIVGTNNAAPVFTRAFDAPVVGYKWIGGTDDDISGVSVSGGEANRIGYATQDSTFDGFGQQQLKFWDVTNPGPDIATGGADPYSAVDDAGNTGGYRSFGGAVGTVDVSDLFAGSLYIFYGAFNATPSVSAVLKDTDGSAPDIVISNAHLNGDNANRTEYYVAELDFVTDNVYDTLEFEHLANSVDYTGNGRGLGSLLTGSDVPPAELSLLVNRATGEVTLVGDDNGDVSMSYYQISSAGGSLNAVDWNSLADQDFDGNGPPDGSGNGWEEAGGSGQSVLAEGYLLGDSVFSAGNEYDLGRAYDESIDTQDLQFEYLNNQDLVIQGAVEYISILHGDYNNDNVVDLSDYTVWRNNLGAAEGALPNDADGGVIGMDQYDTWKANFGLSVPNAALSISTVPEPASLILSCVTLALLPAFRSFKI